MALRLNDLLDPTALQVLNFYVAPFLLEVLGNKASMAMMWCWFTAKKASTIQQISINFRLNVPRSHQVKELPFIGWPIAAVLLVVVKDVFIGSQQWGMDIVDVKNSLEKESEVILLGETGQLRNVIQSSVDNALKARLLEPREKLLS